MSDNSYAGQITLNNKKYRVNSYGDKIAIDKYAGRFVWTDFAAPWCSACAPQTAAVKRLESSYSGKVVFITIMTSNSPGGNAPSSSQTAKDWAKRFNLDPEKVLAAPELWTRTVPTHFFYSPTGQTLLHHTGGLSEGQIREILDRYIYDWEQWNLSGTRADWMRD